MTDLQYMFEKMLKEHFQGITDDNRNRLPVSDYVKDLWTAFKAGYNSKE